MRYLSGIHALNLNCSLDTCGDWHQSALRWEELDWRESDGSVWGDYGIEENSHIPKHPGTYKTANHIRALLDLLADGNTALAQGMRDELVDNDKYTLEIFSKVILLKQLPVWPKVDDFMGMEYFRQWLEYKDEKQCKKFIPKSLPTVALSCNFSSLSDDDINRLARIKALDYVSSNSIRDLYDLSFVINNYYDKLAVTTIEFVSDLMQYNDLELADYLLAVQHDELVAPEVLIQEFLKMHDKLGLLYSDNEKAVLEAYSKEMMPPHIGDKA